MQALEMLEAEHDDLRALLVKLQRAAGTQARHIFAEVRRELRLHHDIEEAYFYPPLHQDEVAREAVLEALEEHRLIQLIVDELSALKPSDERWSAKVKVLAELAGHHIDVEEQRLFPRARTIWSEDKCRHIGRAMEDLKARRRRELELDSSAAVQP